jgi:hypothetical protein
MNRDLHSTIKSVQHLECKAYTTTQTPSSGVDTQGFDSLEFLIAVGVITSGAESPAVKGWSFKLQESDDESSNFTDVTDEDSVLVGSAKSPVTTPDASTGVFLETDLEDQETYRIGYRGSKRYVRCVATAVNTPGSTPLFITALLGNPSQVPTAD